MAHIEDRWWRNKKDPGTGQLLLNSKGKPLKEHTERFGNGMRYRVCYTDPDGVERKTSFPDKRLKEAQDFKKKVEHDLRAKSYIAPDAGHILLRDYCDEYQKGRSQDPSSKETIGYLFDNQVYPVMGDKYLSNVTVSTIRDWYAWMNRADGISITYQAQTWANLRSALDAAVIEKKIEQNPLRNPTLSPPKRILRVVTPWPRWKIDKIADGLPDRAKPIVPIGAGLGLRQGEVLAFSPDNIEKHNGKYRYHCTRQIHYAGGTLWLKLPKNHKTRIVPLGHGVYETIQESMPLSLS